MNGASALVIGVPSSITSASDWKTYLSTHPLTVIYELATPTTESADAYTNPQIVDDWGTEEVVVTEQNGVAMPVGHDSKYPVNLKAKLEMMPNSPSSDGDYLLHHENGVNTYTQYVSRVPNAPSTDGTYILKATVSGGTATLSWVEET